MALFGKKKRNEDDYLLDESEQGFIIHFDEGEKEEEEETFFKGAHKAPHAITIDEVKKSLHRSPLRFRWRENIIHLPPRTF